MLRAIAAVMGRASARARPDWGARPYRVLFLRHDRIGDMILSTGVIRAIAESHPTIRLDVLASPANAPVLSHDPHVASVVVVDTRKPLGYPAAAWRLRRARYDAVVDCMVTHPSLTTLLLMLASGAPHRVGVAEHGNEFAYTIPVPPLAGERHIVEHLATLAGAFGVNVDATDFRPAIALAAAEREAAERRWDAPDTGNTSEAVEAAARARPRRVLVNVSTGIPQRGWPDERFVAALRHVRRRDPSARVLVIGSPADAGRAERVAREGGAAYARTPALREALALVATADLVFTPDTSIAHAASAFRRPAVAMFIPRNLARWHLYGTAGRSLVSTENQLESLPLEPVLEALDEMLASSV